MPELLRPAEKLAFVSREPHAAADLTFKQAKRAYEVCDLEESVFTRFHGLGELNGAWQGCGCDTLEKVGDGLLPAVVIDLYALVGGEHVPVTDGEVGELSFKECRHLGKIAGISLVDGKTMVGKAYLTREGHHAVEYPAAQVAGHEAESVVAVQNGADVEAQVLDADFLKSANNESPAASQDQPITVATPQGPVTLSVATPLPRQAIPGDRQRIADAAAASKHPAEAWLARFAEPGRKPPATGGTPVVPDAAKMAAPHTSRPSSADFETALREPIRIASTDFTEVVDLKRIVTGMKREMRAYIAGGGTVEQYLAELEKRQRLEISYRDNAERRLNDMLNGKDARSRSGQPSLKAAYAYWLKANAQLQAMGIYPLALPDVLRSYQMSLDIEE